ncbi:LOG family protein [Hylemonella sp. W303a]|uniref:LOG family protein n=1 Tax=Hylemonella sp. W303a TaxID=3389873 RepID=UPI00396B40F7
MKLPLFPRLLILAGVMILAGCASTRDCPSVVPNASYTGPYKGVDNQLSVADLNRDLQCAQNFKTTKYPGGFVAIYGSSRIGEASRLPDPVLARQSEALYADVMTFAEAWTRKHGKQYPVMTGAGPGLMEAGNRGALKAGGPSIGYTTYYDPAPRGDANEVFWKYKGQDLITDGLIFSSVGIREYAMFLHSAAIVIGPGGTGTEWELFQILEMIKSEQLQAVPIYLVGNKDVHWKSFYDRLDDMVRRGTIRTGEVTKHFEHIERAVDLVPLLEKRLGLP